MKRLTLLTLLACGILSAQAPWTPYQFWQPNDVRLQLPGGISVTGIRNAVVVGIAFLDSTTIIGNVSYNTLTICSGRGCQPKKIPHAFIVTWDLNGAVLSYISGTLVPDSAPVSDFTYPLCNIGDPQPCRYPPGYGLTEVITWASSGGYDIGGNKVYGNSYYDETGFIHLTP